MCIYRWTSTAAQRLRRDLRLEQRRRQSYTNFSHGVHFGSSNLIQVYENGNNRGNVGSGWVPARCIGFITLAVGGSATYEMQSTDGNYPAIGSAS